MNQKIKSFQEELLREKENIIGSLDYKELQSHGLYIGQNSNDYTRLKYYELDIKNIDRLITFTEILLGEK